MALFFNKEPMVLVNNMDSYFKRTPPDCSFYSRDYSEVPIHKELLYQTQYLRSMVKSAGFEIDIYRDKLEIFTELAKDELEAMVEFLYSGEIYCNQIVASQVSENLIDLFGFPSNFVSNAEPKFYDSRIQKRPDKPIMPPLGARRDFEDNSDWVRRDFFKEHDFKEHDFKEHDFKEDPEVVQVKEEVPEYDNDMPDYDNYDDNYNDDKYNDDNDPSYLPLDVNLKEEAFKSENGKTKKRTKKKRVKTEDGEGYVRPKSSCTLCGKAITFSNTKNHFRAHHKKTCHLCFKNFESKEDVKNHVATDHVGKKPVRCGCCGLRSHYKRNLQKHVRDYHKENPCCMAYDDAHMKMNHILEAHILFDCMFCDTTFSQEKDYIEHLKLEHNIQYNCDQCENYEISTVTQDQHRKRNHEDGKKYALAQYEKNKAQNHTCTICSKRFVTKSSLNSHIRYIHEKQKKPRYHCSMCEYSHCNKSGLKMHVESVHEGRKYICSYCGEEFTSQSRLDGHVAFNHDRSKLYKCTFCDSEFRFEYYLKDHIALVHEKTTRYLCTHCGQSCLNQGDLNFHIKRMHELDGKKPFQCSECDRSYKMSATLKEHIKTVHRGEKIKCTLCEKSFCSQKSVRIHIEAVHEKKRPHACGLCGERFGQKSHLNTHIKGKHKGQKN